jgi:Uma2 family endonuclease
MVITDMAPIPQHQAIVREILVLFTLRARLTGGRAYAAPVDVYLDEYNVYQPDVLYLTADSACVVGEKRLVGAPDLVVEVLSTSTARLDRQVKFNAYEAHGVAEYWLVDPLYQVVEVWCQGGAGRLLRQGVYGVEDHFTSVTLGEVISVAGVLTG